MAFVTPNTVTLGGRGFSLMRSRAFRYLRTASGYPVTLYDTLADKPKSLAVYGASGGVGDYDSTKQAYKIPILVGNNKTINLYAPQQLEARESINLCSIATANSNINTLSPVVAGKTYTLSVDLTAGGFNLRIYNSNGGVAQTITAGSVNIKTFTPSAAGYLGFNIYGGAILNNIMLVEGSYTSATMPDYEPYGATITDTLTISDNAATLSPKTTGGSDTDVPDMQDWTQDMTLPKANELTVTAGTTVEPDGIEVEYYSTQEGDD